MSQESGDPIVERKHVTIMFTDIVGYTALMGSDEDKAFEILRKNRSIHQDLSKKYNGKLIKELGDGMLLSFNLPSDAVRCAIEIQTTCKEEQIPLKVGIHDGEVTFEGNDVFGDGVNISSRLQADARKGNIYVSDSVYRNVRNKKGINSRFIDEKSYKNVDEVIKVYQIITSDDELLEKPFRAKKTWRRNLIFAIIGVSGLILSAFLIWLLYPSPGIEQERSIAVMPFDNVTGDSTNIYLANGMMVEIRNHLAKVHDLRVLSKTSTEKYRDSELSLQEIAEELNVNYLLEGAIQKQDEMIRFHAELISIREDDHVWAESFTRQIDKLFDLQTEIAESVAGQMRAIITPEERTLITKNPTSNPEAYDLYLRGKEFLFRGGKLNFANAIHQFEKAIGLDPEFAQAYVWLGMAYFQQSGSEDYLNENYGDTMIYFARKALALNPNLSDGYWLLAEYFWHKTQNDSSIYYAKKAIEIDPNNGLAYQALGVNYYMIKEIPNAFINLEKARKILAGNADQYPLNLNWRATVYMAIGDYDKSHNILEESLDYNKAFGYWGLWILNFTKGEFDKSKNYIDSLCAIDSASCLDGLALYYIYSDQINKFRAENDDLGLIDNLNNVWKAYVFQKIDQPREAEIFFNQAYEYLTKTIQLERISGKGGLSHYDLAAQYAFIEKKEESYYILHLMEEKKNLECWMVWWMEYDPRFESIRDEEEFKAIIQRQEDRYAEIRAQVDELEKAGVF